MESDDQPLTSEKPNDEQGGSQVRSYECTFCKRGFSNAQALGGHMNIHRKDKAKLKQSSNEPWTIPKVSASLGTMEAKPGEDRSNPNWPWNIDDASSRDETHVVHIRQLPLFAETPAGETQNPELGPSHWEIDAEKALPSGQGSSSDLDLELRLGPDPQDPSATMATRKFF